VIEGILIFLMFGAIGRVLVAATKDHFATVPFQLKLFFLAYFLRFAFSFLLYAMGFAELLGDYDSVGWRAGWLMARSWEFDRVSLLDLPVKWLEAFVGNHLGYYYLSATTFFLSNTDSRLVMAVINCFLGALTVVLAYRVARTLFSEAVAARVGWWSCLFPSMIIWSAQTLKEPVVIFFEILALYSCLQLRERGFNVKHVLLAGFAVVALFPFRFYASYIAALAILVSMVTPQLSRRRITIGPAVMLLLLVVPILIYTGGAAEAESRIEGFDLKFVEDFRVNVAQEGNSGVRTDVDMQTTSGFSLGTLIGAAHLLLAPFPWQLGASLKMLMTIPEIVYWWWLFFFGVVPGFWYVVRKRFYDVLPLLIFVFAIGTLYSMMFGNVGLILRQRAQILPWLFVLGSVGLEVRHAKKEHRDHERLELLRRSAGLETA
jgi:4-amino-4-deoxy-L-arabinose transferase-like glycosyltransferase